MDKVVEVKLDLTPERPYFIMVVEYDLDSFENREDVEATVQEMVWKAHDTGEVKVSRLYFPPVTLPEEVRDIV